MSKRSFAITILVFSLTPLFASAQYNMGAMWQGPRLVFSVSPSSTAAVATNFATQPTVALTNPKGTVITNMAKSITLGAYTDNKCTSAASGTLDVTTNPVSLSSGTAAFSGVDYSADATIYLRASAPGARSVCWGPIVIGTGGGGGGGQPNQLPTQTPLRLYILGATEIGAGACQAYTIVSQNPYGASVKPPSTVTINLSGAGSGTFYSNSNCSTSTTTASIPTTADSTIVYYKNATAESVVLQAADAAAVLSSGSLLVKTYSRMLVLTGPAVLPSGTACGVATNYQINYLNGGGTQYGSSIAVRIDGYQGGSGGSANAIYTASGCTGGSKISGTGPVTVSGTGAYNFYYARNTGGDYTLKVYADTETGVQPDTLFVDMTTAPTQLKVFGPGAAATNTCTDYWVKSYATSTAAVALDTTVTLTKTGSALLYSDKFCANAMSAGTIAAGESTLKFYAKNAVAESVTLTAAATGLTSGNLTTAFLTASVTPGVAAGEATTCALSSKGMVKCWGEGPLIGAGDGSQPTTTLPQSVVGITKAVTKISSYFDHTCALLSDQTAMCWGMNGSGQLGTGGTSPAYSAVAVASLTGIVDIAAGESHTCALLSDQTVRCWGLGTNGQLGQGTAATSYTPVNPGLTTVTKLSVGYYHSCAVLADKTARCWGYNPYGEIGDGTINQANSPVTVSGLANVEHIGAGTYSTCATLTGGAVKCWGRNLNGQLGDGTKTNSLTPVTVSGVANGSKVKANGPFNLGFACALLSDATMKCWGGNVLGQLGNGTVEFDGSPTPVAVSSLSNVTDFALGAYHACALLSDETMKCWGGNDYGKLGNGSRMSSPYPTVGPLTNIAEIHAGSEHTCAKLSDGKVNCWGNNNYGQLGLGTMTSYLLNSEPVGDGTAREVPGLGAVDSLAVGDSHNCVIIAGAVKCWGYGGGGQLGNNATLNSSVPVSVIGIANATQLSLGNVHSCARLSDSTIKCWGGNQYGSLGDNTAPTNHSAPVTVSGINNATSVSVGAQHSCARLSDATIKCWGLNTNAQMGDPTTYPTSTTYLGTPVQAGTNMTNVTSIHAGRSSHICAYKGDGSVWCWGFNDFGMMGNGSPGSNFEAPSAVTGLTNVASLSLGAYHACARMSDSTMRCWGNNLSGQLGDGTYVNRSLIITPQISGVAQISMGDEYSCAKMSDNTSKCWGLNTKRQFGVNFSTPLYVIGVPF